MSAEADLTLSCGCTFTADDDGTLQIRPCSWDHADHWTLLAVEYGLGTDGIQYVHEAR